MDELSEGIIFRAADAVQMAEARAAYTYVAAGEHAPLDRSAVFTYIVDCLGDGQITFAAGTSVAQMNSLVEHWNSSLEFRSVLWFLAHIDPDQMNAHHVDMERRFVELSAANIKRSEAHFRGQNQFSKARLQHEERVELLRSMVIPAFTKIILEDHPVEDVPRVVADVMARFNEAQGRGSPQLLKTVFSLMPSMDLFAQLMAARTMNPGRAVQPQDYWDVEHAQVAAAYGDAFVTLDRGLLDLLRARSTVPRDRGCRLLGSLTDLMTFIGEDFVAATPGLE